MTPDEILEIDAERNYPPGIEAGHLRAEINDFLRKRGHIVQQGDTLIMFKNSGGKDVEFHTFNADSPQNLISNVMKFLVLAKKLGYETATTQYENPKIGELFKQGASKGYEVSVSKKDGFYEAKVRL